MKMKSRRCLSALLAFVMLFCTAPHLRQCGAGEHTDHRGGGFAGGECKAL